MAISNYTTKVDSMKTIGEIQAILAAHNAEKIMVEFSNKIAVGITFQIMNANGLISFRLPANWEGVFKAIEKDGKVPKALKTKEQALRVAWRIIKDWVEAQMAIVQAELATVDEVFFPYAILKSGNTIYQDMKTNPQLLLGN